LFPYHNNLSTCIVNFSTGSLDIPGVGAPKVGTEHRYGSLSREGILFLEKFEIGT